MPPSTLAVGKKVSGATGNQIVRFGYGAQSNTVTKVTNANSITTYTARDVSNLEVSAGYNYMNSAIKGGVWYQSVVLGKTSTATSSSKNDLTYTASATDDSQTINTVGVGVTGNSKLWGMVDLLFTGDALTYALGYQNATGQLVTNTSTASITPFTNATLTTDIYNVGIGYMQEKFSLEFNYAMSNASKEIYLNSVEASFADLEIKEKLRRDITF